MKITTPIKIILADDHEIFRDGFKAMLKKQPSVELIGEASNGEELVELTRQLKPDVIVTDIKMPKMDGLQATKLLTLEFPQIGIIALSMIDEENLIIDMMEAGAKGYLLKNAHKDEIIEAIKAVNNNHIYYCDGASSKLTRMIAQNERIPFIRKTPKLEFSEKELAVIQYICQEMTNKEIASQLDLSIRTIEGYRDRIQEKIGAKNSAGIVVYAIRNNIYKV
jgi:two-component system, NarL family, response regulator NreC